MTKPADHPLAKAMEACDTVQQKAELAKIFVAGVMIVDLLTRQYLPPLREHWWQVWRPKTRGEQAARSWGRSHDAG